MYILFGFQDYTGNAVSTENSLNVLLWNKIALSGQPTGKAIDSGPDDTIFVYYSNHGAEGVLYIPDDYITANKFHAALNMKFEKNRYKNMLIKIRNKK